MVSHIYFILRWGAMDRKFVTDLFKYVFVAVFALAADFGSLMCLHVLGVQYIVAATLAFLIGTIVNFSLSHGYVFKDPVIKNKTMNFVMFATIGVAGLIANDVIIWLLHGRADQNLALSKLAAVIIVFFWNFLARRQLLYRGHKEDITKEISFEG